MPRTTESLESGAYIPLGAARGQPLQLAMQELYLTGRILPVGADLLVRHSFRSAEKKMLEAIYSFVLPRDAALRRFEIKGEGFAVKSALKPVEEATRAYEEGIAEGHLATLARQYGDGLVNLSLGNLRPGEAVTVSLEIIAGVELRDDGLRFRFPFTLAPSYHSQARAAELAPGAGEIELPGDLFGDVLLPRFQKSAEGLHQVSFDLALEMPWDVTDIASASHAVRISKNSRILLAPESDLPDRDLIIDVRFDSAGARTLVGEGESGRRHFASVIPSTEFGVPDQAPRNVVLLLDRSGSMSGKPMDQARKAAAACLGALSPEDQFGLVAFDDTCELFRQGLSQATAENRHAAAQFLDAIDARGGTKLSDGVRKAAGLLRGTGGDIFILTDGQVFGTEDILAEARATGCRLHLLGIGSASQDRFLTLLARETNGVSRFVTPRERVDEAALSLFASVSRPAATELKVAGNGPGAMSISPDPPTHVFGGTPVVLFGECEGRAAGSIVLDFQSGQRSGSLEIAIGEGTNACGESLRVLRGSRLVTDAEARVAEGTSAAAERQDRRWEAYLRRLSEQYGLASRAMALVAVVERAGDAPGEPPKTHIVPVGLPQDMAFEGIFARSTGMAFDAGSVATDTDDRMTLAAPKLLLHETRGWGHALWRRVLGSENGISASTSGSMPGAGYDEAEAGTADVFGTMLELSITIREDGSMPGGTARDSILATLVALLTFLSEGNSVNSGPFRMHIARMLDYLDKALPGDLSPREVTAAGLVVDAVRAGRAVDGAWADLAKELLQGKKDAIDRGWESLLHMNI